MGNNRDRMGHLIERVAETGDFPKIREESVLDCTPYVYRNLLDSFTNCTKALQLIN